MGIFVPYRTYGKRSDKEKKTFSKILKTEYFWKRRKNILDFINIFTLLAKNIWRKTIIYSKIKSIYLKNYFIKFFVIGTYRTLYDYIKFFCNILRFQNSVCWVIYIFRTFFYFLGFPKISYNFIWFCRIS